VVKLTGEPARWLVLQEGARRRWGGDLRRAFVFAELAARTDATIATSWAAPSVRDAIDRASGRRRSWSRPAIPFMASAELLPTTVVDEARRAADLFALDVHDDPIRQPRVLGLGEADAALEQRWRANIAAFRWLVVPSVSFSELAGLHPARLRVMPNGTDPRHIVPGPFPGQPTVGFVSAAAPGRGVELLIEAARSIRPRYPDLRLLLWLVATSELGNGYVTALEAGCRADRWIEIGAVPYERLGDELARASVLVIPHPPGTYYDAALPVKLFDSMAAGRPVVVTPRAESRSVVEAAGAGLVARGDGVDDVAEAIEALLADQRLARTLGSAARRAAEEAYDWRLLSAGVADRLLREAGLHAPAARPWSARQAVRLASSGSLRRARRWIRRAARR
jgi:glycosyltransferase involved in cell wall biosynthesis